MIIFIEDASLKISNSWTFQEAIEILNDAINKEDDVILYNFFTDCCNLKDHQIRGLERIAMSNGAQVIGDNSRIKQIRNCSRNKKPLHQAGIGNFYEGNILIVGDTPGKNANGLNVPFVGSGCGDWLLKQLEEEDVDENKLFWINSTNENGEVEKLDFIYYLNPRQIICLGNNAYNWCKHLKDEYTIEKIPHPQYWKRFKSKELYPLFELL